MSRFVPENPRFGELFTRQPDNAVRAAEALWLRPTGSADLEVNVLRLRDFHRGLQAGRVAGGRAHRHPWRLTIPTSIALGWLCPKGASLF